MAEDLGRRLLREVEEVQFDEVLDLLRSLATEQSHPTSHTNIFDRILYTVSGHQQPLHTGLKPRLPVLEICSEDTGAGKSQLLYLLIAVAVLPDLHGSTVLNGKQGAVIVFDTHGRFNPARLAQVMTMHIRSASLDDTVSSDLDALISRSLQHVHVFQPQSMKSMLDSLAHLKDYLFDSSAHSSSRRAVHAIVLDSADAFQFQTRADLENHRLAALDASNASTSAALASITNPYSELSSRLRALQQALSCAVIATSHLSYYQDALTGERTPRTLPAVWSGFPTAKLVVKRQSVGKFAPGFSWEEAVRDRELRQTEVEKGIFVASLLSGRECFRYAITNQGVKLIEPESGMEGNSA